MRKIRLFMGTLMLVSSLTLMSCGILEDDIVNTTSKTTTTKTQQTSDKDVTTTTGNISTTSLSTTISTTTQNTVRYEVGTSEVTQWTDSLSSKWIKVAVPITNTGTTNLYLDDCTIDIESSSGTLLKTMSYVNGYPEYIKPGETGYYYDETTVDFTETNVVAVPNVQVEKATNDVIRYDVTEVTISSDTYNGVKVMGRVQNNTSKKGTMVVVAANLFDSNGKLICNCFTYLENDLNSGSKVGFSMTPFAYTKVIPSDVASYEVYAYPTQFNW